MTSPEADTLHRKEAATMPEYLTPGDAARILNVSRESVRRYTDLGYLEAYRTPGGQRRIVAESVTALVQARTRVSSTVSTIEAR